MEKIKKLWNTIKDFIIYYKVKIIIIIIILILSLFAIKIISKINNIKSIYIDYNESDVSVSYGPYQNDTILLKIGNTFPLQIKTEPKKVLAPIHCDYDHSIISYKKKKITALNSGKTTIKCTVGFFHKIESNTLEIEVEE